LHSLSFVDDPTRILRAARFEQRFGFRIEERTMQLLMEARSLIDRLSGDRIRHELNHILNTESLPPAAAIQSGAPQTGGPAQILARLHELGLLAAIHPNLTWDEWLHKRIGALSGLAPDADWGLSADGLEAPLKVELGYILWLIRLPAGQASLTGGRLKLPAYLARIILDACELWHDRYALLGLSPSVAVARLEDESILARYAVYMAASEAPELQEVLQTYQTRWQRVEPIIDGHGLKALGLTPGPQYRKILSRLRNAWLDGEISTPEGEMALLKKIIGEG
jgi:tRNA nucleotidyltransferase (CCA-adding enzyme)